MGPTAWWQYWPGAQWQVGCEYWGLAPPPGRGRGSGPAGSWAPRRRWALESMLRGVDGAAPRLRGAARRPLPAGQKSA